MNQDKVFITKEKYDELKIEFANLTTNSRTEIAERLDSAKALGDLKENAEYHQAREDQAILEERINRIQSILKNAEIIKTTEHQQVEIGALVTIARKGSSAKQSYQIVGQEESDAQNGKLSHHSPLVVAMLGKKEGDFFNFTTPGGEQVTWKVVEVK
ncbi:MAG: transcription elongation factor GreA [Patescibacteria group bacterium]